MTGFFAFIIAMGFDAVLFAAAYTKYREVRAARAWISAHGEIVLSQAVVREVKTPHDSPLGNYATHFTTKAPRNFASIAYTFETPQGVKRGTRVKVGEDGGNFEVAEQLARYPAGKKVTVWYDPANPEKCVIERDLPDRMFFWLFVFCAAFAVAALALLVWGDHLFDAIARHLPRTANASAALMLMGMGVFAALLGLAARKQCAIARAWPIVTGRVLDAGAGEVEATVTRPGSIVDGSYKRKLFYTKVVYAYEVAKVRYTSDRVSFGMQNWASVSFFARRSARAFTAGAPVEVRYDPENPSQAVLIPKAPGTIMIWAASAALLGWGARIAGLI